MSDRAETTRISAAILGMYAAIKLCRLVGIWPEDLLDMVRCHVEAEADA